ncbi:MAG: hypothetical protein FJ264_04240 [Planctomycetes bacterium]|nr:hypothetical protein [Planctomycetota bacterium]
MASCNTKAKAIMVVLVGLFGLLCVGFAVSVTEKYRLQKERVHGLERQLKAGRSEVLKVPDLMQKLDNVESSKKELENTFAECSAAKDELTEKVGELQVEVDSFGVVKAAVGLQIAELEGIIKEQQQKISEAEENSTTLSGQIAALEEERGSNEEKFKMQIEDIKRGQEDTKNQLIYFTEAKKISDKEIEEKKKLIHELEAELTRLKSGAETSSAPSTTSAVSAAQWDLNLTEELNKTFTLLRERISSPTMSLSEVSILLSRAEHALKRLK